jgi:hypothetical protein
MDMKFETRECAPKKKEEERFKQAIRPGLDFKNDGYTQAGE